MKVFANPAIALHSTAMVRIYRAILAHCMYDVEFTDDITAADLVIFYPISGDWFKLIDECVARGQKYALVQCTSVGDRAEWVKRWAKAECVWSYLDLLRDYRYDTHGSLSSMPSAVDLADAIDRYYYAPLGVDSAVFNCPYHYRHSHIPSPPSRKYIVTTGFVHGRPAEAITEAWRAARIVGLPVVHVGGWPVGIDNKPNNVVGTKLRWPHVQHAPGVSDSVLADIYRQARYVVSLRYSEGFELPAAEGLCCGARAILFDQADLRRWYGNHAIYLPELDGNELVERLVEVFGSNVPVEEEERRETVKLFDWAPIVDGFWKEILR